MKRKVYKNYRPLCYLTDNNLLVVKYNTLFKYDIKKGVFNKIAKINYGFINNFLIKIKIFARLLRLGVHYAVNLDANNIMLVYNKSIYKLCLKSKRVEKEFALKRGKRPLMMSYVEDIKGFDNAIFFGEYFSNHIKDEVHVYKRLNNGEWVIIYTFPKNTIEHIHAIIPDTYFQHVWILTGDFDNSAGIWIAKNNFKTVEPVLVGSQQYRASIGFPTSKGFIYATDSQLEQNNVRLLYSKNNTWESKHIYNLNGSCIYGCKVNDKLVFSTSVEPGKIEGSIIKKILNRKRGQGILTDDATVVVGNQESGFKIISKNKKDALPFIPFQFGSIIFPSGKNNSNNLFLYNIGLKKDDLSMEVINFEDLQIV